ncbi:MAG: hypothetical protein ACPL1D_02050 [Microgenomates group bacterium]
MNLFKSKKRDLNQKINSKTKHPVIKINKKDIEINWTHTSLVLIIFFLFFIILVFIMRYLVIREIDKARYEFNKTLLEINSYNSHNTSIIDYNATSPDISLKLKDKGVTHFYLSELEKINNHYVPKVYLCLFKNGQPIYPRYVYENWSQLNYPNNINPKVSLLKFIFLPEDDKDFIIDSKCYLKEIKTDRDWQNVKEKYGFSKELFI